MSPPAGGSIAARLRRLDWPGLAARLDETGFARAPRLLTGEECARMARLYSDDRRFRKTIDMERHRFGSGEYRYFRAPLPPAVAALREAAYPHLAPIANRWMRALRLRTRFPKRLERFLARCHSTGQTKPTPLLLRYGAGGYNCLHQDLYGAVAFPLQIAVVLSRPGVDYEGGEFLLVEQRPRAQSIGHALAATQGEMIVFANRERPVAGRRGHYRANVRHGVSRVHRGIRVTLGIIFHDAA